MDGEEFERQLADDYEKEGFEVHQTPKTNDKGVDLILKRGSHTIAVQAKGYADDNKVSSSAVQKASGLLARDDIDEVRVATTSSFTSPARDVAENRDVTLRSGVSTGTQRTERRSHYPEFGSTKYNTRRERAATSSTSPISYPDRTIEEHTCPTCGRVMNRTGWFPYYRHFEDCGLPEEKPEQLSESQWTKIQEKIAQPKSDHDDTVRSTALRFTSKADDRRNHRSDSGTPDVDDGESKEGYTCPGCEEVLKRTGWFPYYRHFEDCELPEEKPEQLSDDQWTKIQDKIERTNNGRSSSSTSDIDGEENNTSSSQSTCRCPSCDREIATGVTKLASHYEECELPSETPADLRREQWEEIQNRVSENDQPRESRSSDDPSQLSTSEGVDSTAPESRGFFGRLRSLF